MTWQNKLRELDEALGAGRIAADDYRIRREQLLAAAAGTQDAPSAPSASQATEGTQVISPVQPPPGATQVMQGWQASQGSEADRTQVVHGVARPAPHPGQGPPQAPQGLHQLPQQAPPGTFPQHDAQNQSWDDDQEKLRPPWSGSDFPPLAPTPGWIKQGPEAFDKSTSRGKRVMLIAGIVVAVVLLGLGVWWFGLRQTGTGRAAPTATHPATIITIPKKLIDQVPNTPGQPNPSNGLLTLDAAQTAGAITADQLQAAQTAGDRNVAVKGSTDNGFTYQVLVFTATDGNAANQLATALIDLDRQTGMVAGAHGVLPANASVLQYVRPGDTAHYTAVYSAGKDVVLIDAVQKPAGPDDKAILDQFEPLASSVTAAFPGS